MPMRGDGYFLWAVGLAVAFVISVLVARLNSQRADRENQSRIKAWDEVKRKEAELTDLRLSTARELAAKDADMAKIVARVEGMAKIVAERKIQFPWLVSAIADFFALEAER